MSHSHKALPALILSLSLATAAHAARNRARSGATRTCSEGHDRQDTNGSTTHQDQVRPGTKVGGDS